MNHDDKGEVLRGAEKIAEFLRELLDEPDLKPAKVWQWAAYGRIPTRKMGANLVSTKSALRRHFQPDAA